MPSTYMTKAITGNVVDNGDAVHYDPDKDIVDAGVGVTGVLYDTLNNRFNSSVTSFDTVKITDSVYFVAVENGDSGAAATIDWTTGNKQHITLTDDVTLTFTGTAGASNFVLKLTQDDTGTRLVTWPATVKWPGGTAPTLTTDADAIDIITFYFDGTNYYGSSSLDFS